MTDSSTPCSRKPPERRRFIGGVVALAAASSLGLAPTPATAAEAEIRNVALVLADDTYVLNADIVAERMNHGGLHSGEPGLHLK